MKDQKKSKHRAWLIFGEPIDGVHYRLLSPVRDARGSFTEAFYDSWGIGVNPSQWSVVHSNSNVLRGMHLHLHHDEYISVVQGSGYIGLYDLRKESITYRARSLIKVEGSTPACVTFPRGILHGWYFSEPSIHIQAISSTFAEYGKIDNWGCYFGDPDLGIPWPDKNPIVSDRARNFPTMVKLEQLLDSRINQPDEGAKFEKIRASYANTEIITSGMPRD